MRSMQMAKFQHQGMSPGDASAAATKFLNSFEGSGKFAQFGKKLSSVQGFYSQRNRVGKIIRALAKDVADDQVIYKGLGKLSPVKILSAAGAAIGAAAVLPFLPGALVPSKRPDELEAIYSGVRCCTKQSTPQPEVEWKELLSVTDLNWECMEVCLKKQ